MVITLDFETYDPDITKTKSSGWPYNAVDLLCAGVKENDNPAYVFDLTDEDNLVKFKSYIAEHNKKGTQLIAHNAQYELGLLHMLKLDYTQYTVIDTELLSKLQNNLRNKHNLDSVAYDILGKRKLNNLLEEKIKEFSDHISIKSNTNLGELSKRNMHLLYDKYPNIVSEYCIQDVELTYSLYQYFNEHLDVDYDFYSDLVKACVVSRARGVRVNLKRVRSAYDLFNNKAQEFEEKAKQEVNNPGLNIQSTPQIAKVFDQIGCSYKTTQKGNPSITKSDLESINIPFCNYIIQSKKYQLAAKEYCKKTLDIAKNITPCGTYGYVYPTFNIFGAKTGRMSCKGPNLQKIPKHDKEIGPICRHFFVPHEGEKWYSFDYSAQEQRLQIHYAHKFKLPEVEPFVQALRANPNMDLHKYAAEAMYGSYDPEMRGIVKTINFGLGYGMGIASLAVQLGVNQTTAQDMLDKYNHACGYIQKGREAVLARLAKKGYIKTLLNRHVNVLPLSAHTQAYNAVMQGGGVDLLQSAMVLLYRKGITAVVFVHDELNFSFKPDDTAQKKINTIIDTMENSISLAIPMKVDYNEGNSWHEAK